MSTINKEHAAFGTCVCQINIPAEDVSRENLIKALDNCKICNGMGLSHFVDENPGMDLKVEALKSFPPKANPFHFDHTSVGMAAWNKHIMIMEVDFNPYYGEPGIILVNTTTGKRVRISGLDLLSDEQQAKRKKHEEDEKNGAIEDAQSSQDD